MITTICDIHMVFPIWISHMEGLWSVHKGFHIILKLPSIVAQSMAAGAELLVSRPQAVEDHFRKDPNVLMVYVVNEKLPYHWWTNLMWPMWKPQMTIRNFGICPGIIWGHLIMFGWIVSKSHENSHLKQQESSYEQYRFLFFVFFLLKACIIRWSTIFNLSWRLEYLTNVLMNKFMK